MRFDYEWVKVDGCLYSEGLELIWIGLKGRVIVILDLEFCDGKVFYFLYENVYRFIEVVFIYSFNNFKVGEDIGVLVVKR